MNPDAWLFKADLFIKLSRDGHIALRQAEAGLDIMNDGDQLKPNRATYIKDRLNGFGGTGNSLAFQDIEIFR